MSIVPKSKGGGGSVNIKNATVRKYYGQTTIEKNNFIEFINDSENNETSKVQLSISKIDGLTKTTCSPTTQGEVWVWQ